MKMDYKSLIESKLSGNGYENFFFLKKMVKVKEKTLIDSCDNRPFSEMRTLTTQIVMLGELMSRYNSGESEEVIQKGLNYKTHIPVGN